MILDSVADFLPLFNSVRPALPRLGTPLIILIFEGAVCGPSEQAGSKHLQTRQEIMSAGYPGSLAQAVLTNYHYLPIAAV
jgi:hypothetical protein